MTIKHDEWLYVHTTTPERAREFFGLPPETEVRESGGETIRPDGMPRCWAVRAPVRETRLPAVAERQSRKVVQTQPESPNKIDDSNCATERFHRCRENA